MTPPFASRPSPKLVFGPGTLGELPACVRDAGGTSVLLVTDHGIVRAGHAARAVSLLESAGIPVALYDHAHENPTEADAATCRDFARAHRFDCFVALGGGSSMDTAKAANFLLTNGGAMRDSTATERRRNRYSRSLRSPRRPAPVANASPTPS